MAERMTMGEASMVFTASDVEFQRVADRVENGARRVTASMEKSGSAVQKLTKALVGREIINQLAEGLLRMSRAAADMSVKVRLGEASIGELVEEAAKGIPILGKFFESGRDIREIITGEKAYTEVLAAQTKAQEERADALERYLNLQKASGRQLDDLNKRLEQKPGLGFDVGAALTGGKRAAEDLRGNLDKQFAPALADLDKLRKQFGQKIADLTTRAQEPQGDVPGVGDAILQEIEEWQRRIAILDKRAAELRAVKGKLEEASQLAIGRETLSKAIELIGGSLGGTATKGFDVVGAAIDRYIARLPVMSDTTRQALDATRTDFDRFSQSMAQFNLDLASGAASAGEFNKVTGAAIGKYADGLRASAETAFAAFRNIGQQMTAAIVKQTQDAIDANRDASNVIREQMIERLELAGRLGNEEARINADRLRAEDEIAKKRRELVAITLDKNVGAALRAAAQEAIDQLPAMQAALAKAAAGGGGGGRRASFVGLADMGRRIQEAAGGKDPATDIAAQQLKEQQKANGFAKIIADAQRQLIDALPKVGRLK